jgi:hypothetical protein
MPYFFVFMKHSNFQKLEDEDFDDFVSKDDSLDFLTHLATEHVDSTFRSANVEVTKLELLRTFADRIHKYLPHEEPNLHPGMTIRPKSPKIQ